ncbi:MAG: hypothetical protein ABJB98_10070 [Actinomycetota bacterium]
MAAVSLTLFVGTSRASAHNDCTDSTSTFAGKGKFGIGQKQECSRKSAVLAATQGVPAAPVRDIDCGPVVIRITLTGSPDHFCDAVRADCAVATADQLPKDPRTTTIGHLEQRPDKTWLLQGVTCDAIRGNALPAVTPFMVYEQMVKLVPSPAVKAAPGKGTTLVNIQTIFWVDTPADRSLGAVSLLGHQVALRIHADHVAWDFGDGTTDSSGPVGTAYTAGDNCTTAQCPGFYGHTYTATSSAGAFSVTATTTWSGQYAIDGGAWQDVQSTIDGTNTVTAPAISVTINVVQARGVLVPAPGER